MIDYECETMAWLANQANMSLATLGRRAKAGNFPPTFYVTGGARMVNRADGLAWAAAQLKGRPAA